MGVLISYNGSDIATMSTDDVKTLNTKDKYCKGNIIISYTHPSFKDIIYKNVPIGDIQFEASSDLSPRAVSGWASSNISSLKIDMKTYAFTGSYVFSDNSIPKYHIIYNSNTTIPAYLIGSSLTSCIVVIEGNSTATLSSAIFRSGGLSCIDLAISTNLPTYAFYGCGSFDTMILRKTSGLVTLGGTSAITDTKFKSGGTGGTIYIPKVFYDHLGDGTSLDYKAASNWSTIDSYGTITWAQIENSQYEHYYADGTPISSEGDN